MPISQLISHNGRRYIEYKGKPQLFYGVQLKLCDLYSVGLSEEEIEREIENHFRMSAVCHFPIVCVPVFWSEHIEPALVNSGSSDFVEKCINYCNKYNLSIHWLWFGSNVCGQQLIPKDIWENVEVYPRVEAENFSFVNVSNPLFIEREKSALKYFLDMLVKLDKNQCTSGIQVHNEVDIWFNQRKERQELINILGKVVKDSDFNVLTRVNIRAPRCYLDEDPVIDEILSLENIDCVGVDVYINEVSYCTDFMENMNNRAKGKNLPHFAELGAHVDVLPQLICDTFQRGGGVLLYELKTALKYPGDAPFDFGLYRFSPNNWNERDGTVPVQYQWTEGEMVSEANTADIILLNEMLGIVSEVMATVPIDNIAMILSGEERKIGDMTVSFKTQETGPNAFGMAVLGDDGYLYCFSLADGEFDINGAKALNIQIFEYDSWKSNCDNESINLKLDAKRGYVYRFLVE